MKTKIVSILFFLISYTFLFMNQLSSQSLGNCPEEGIQTYFEDQPDCNTNYILVYSDDFDGEIIDQTKWSKKIGPQRGWDATTYEFCTEAPYCKQWYQPENVTVEDGKLKLIVDDEGIEGTWVVDWDPYTEHTDWFDYRSGEIWSNREFHFGYFEMTCTLPETRGFYPAFWTFGGQLWNEIDFFEINTTTQKHEMAVHYDYTEDGNSERCGSSYDFTNFATTHKYGCEWTPYHVSFFVDDIEKWRYVRHMDWSGFFERDCEDLFPYVSVIEKELFPVEPGSIIANLGVFCNSFKPDHTTLFPSTFEVDYIKYYANINNPEPITIENTEELNLSETEFNIVFGQNVLIKDNVDIDPNDQLELLGNDYIDIHPGVEIFKGSVVNLRIDENMNTEGYYKSHNSDNTTPSLYHQSMNDIVETLNFTDDFYKNLNNQTIEVYPNPSDGNLIFIKVSAILRSATRVEIIDNYGRKCYCGVFSNTELITINNLSLSKGLYLISISINECDLHKYKKLVVL